MYIENTIIIEGLDGAGTTTQARLIGEKFQKEGREVFLTHEPTDNPIGKVVRQVLQKKISTTPEALALLFSSDRDDHLYNEEYGILRQVKENRIVISDRYFYSSIAYQGVQCDMGFVENINSRFPHPRYLIFIDTLPSVCMDRIERRGSKKEIFEKQDFLSRVRTGYLKQLENLPEGVKLLRVNGEKSIEEIEEEIWLWLKENGF